MQQLQNEPYDEEYIVDDGEDVASNLAVTPDARRFGDEDQMTDDDMDQGGAEGQSRGDSPPDHNDYDTGDEGDGLHDGDGMDGPMMSPDDEDAMNQRDYDFGDPQRGGGGEEGGSAGGDDEYDDNQSPEMDMASPTEPMSPDGESASDDDEGAKVEGAYDPADYQNLAVSSDIKELFTYITRYTPQSAALDPQVHG